MLACNDQEGLRHLELSRAMVFRLLARYKEDRRFSVLLPRPQGRKRGSHALLEGQERMISLQIQKVARTGENPSLAALHRKIAAACRKRRLRFKGSLIRLTPRILPNTDVHGEAIFRLPER
jgi:hypothetical protein